MCASLTKTTEERPQIHQKEITKKKLWKSPIMENGKGIMTNFYTCNERFIQGLACLLNIHPSLKISLWSSQASPIENCKGKREKLRKQMSLGSKTWLVTPQVFDRVN
jgi:hypothetical protein